LTVKLFYYPHGMNLPCKTLNQILPNIARTADNQDLHLPLSFKKREQRNLIDPLFPLF